MKKYLERLRQIVRHWRKHIDRDRAKRTARAIK